MRLYLLKGNSLAPFLYYVGRTISVPMINTIAYNFLAPCLYSDIFVFNIAQFLSTWRKHFPSSYFKYNVGPLFARPTKNKDEKVPLAIKPENEQVMEKLF